tara:strand:+ start:206 stop:355 length:150 start_codon:yes stop_codon:yes gene_type:complete
MKEWDLSVGFYPGILIGMRTYHGRTEDGEYKVSHVFYLPLIDLCVDIYK